MTSPLSSPQMIGRDADLERLRALLRATESGVPRTAVIGGEAGIGKSRLLDEFRADVASDGLVITGQCVDLGAVAAPYAPIKAALRALIALVGAPDVVATVGPGRDALVALLPELAEIGEPIAFPGGALPASADQLHEAVAVLLEGYARERPLVVIIEDLHWIDSASLTLLRFLVRALRAGRLLLVLSYRSDDVTRGHPVRGFLSELDRSRAIERWELGRLTRTQVRKLAKAIQGEAPPLEALEIMFERSEGVPFFVEELVGLDACRPDSTLPDTLRDLLLARYERLEPATQAFLRLLAAGGVTVGHGLLERVYAGTADELDAAVREAVVMAVLVVGEDSYSFRHALVREAIHAELLPGERTRFHTRYAEALEQDSDGRRVAAEISSHWMSARVPAKAFPATLDAMAEARAAFAYSTAGQMGERALELWDQIDDPEDVAGMPKVDLLGRTASDLRNAGEGDRSLALIDLALVECPRDDALRYARALRNKAYYLGNVGKLGSIELFEQALELVPPGSPGDLRATLLTPLAGRLMIEGRLDEAVVMAERAYEEAETVGSARYMSIALNIAGVCRVHRGEIEAGRALVERARVLGAGDGNASLRYWVNASDLTFLLGRFDEAVTLAEDGLARARELGVERSSGVILASNAVDPYLALGRWDRADALIERALSLDPPLAFRVYLQRAKLWRMLWGGDVDGAAARYRALRGTMTGLIEVEMQTRLGVARVAGEIALAQGDLDRAWTEASVLFRAEHRALPGYDLPLLALAARVLAAARVASASGSTTQIVADPDAAEAAIRATLDAGRFWPTSGIWGTVVEAELGAGDGGDVALWLAAIDATEAAGAPAHLRPYAALRLAEALVAAGDRPAARDALADAARRADELGIGLVADAATRLAQRAGLAPAVANEAAASADDSPELTARERQVLELIAEGLSNRQIGERLYISGKTASVHVSAILRKLGAATRTEAVFRAQAVRL